MNWVAEDLMPEGNDELNDEDVMSAITVTSYISPRIRSLHSYLSSFTAVVDIRALCLDRAQLFYLAALLWSHEPVEEELC